jgi:two-component system, NtrC family, sensor kinase
MTPDKTFDKTAFSRWHWARAERQGFNVPLERSFDPAAGEAVVFPQDITWKVTSMSALGH